MSVIFNKTSLNEIIEKVILNCYICHETTTLSCGLTCHLLWLIGICAPIDHQIANSQNTQRHYEV